MGTPLSGSFSYTTPNLASSGGTASSSDYNALVADVGVAIAKPWAKLVMTGGTLVPYYPTVPSNPNSPLFASSPPDGTATSVTSTMHQNSPASGAGSFSYSSSSGLITPPSGCPGVYRISAQAVLSSSADAAFARLVVVPVNSSGTSLGAFPGKWTNGSTTGAGHHEIFGVYDVLIPFNVSSWLGTATAYYIDAQGSSGTGTPTIGCTDNGYGPSSSPPVYFTVSDAIFEGNYGSV